MKARLWQNLFILNALILNPNVVANAPSKDIRALQEQGILAVIYQQTSSERLAASIQTFKAARQALDKALADPSWNALPGAHDYQKKKPAIILDVDETVLDNTAYQARMILDGTRYPTGWIDWGNEVEAIGVPGAKEFLEYADVFNNKYGTLISSTKLLADKGYDVLFDIDWQGTQQLSQVEENILTIFILPPSKKEIEKRLKKRESENLENSNIVKDRMLKFEDELSHWKEYDYVVTNDNFDNCVKEIANIINVERIKRANKKSIITKIRDLKD